MGPDPALRAPHPAGRASPSPSGDLAGRARGSTLAGRDPSSAERASTIAGRDLAGLGRASTSAGRDPACSDRAATPAERPVDGPERAPTPSWTGIVLAEPTNDLAAREPERVVWAVMSPSRRVGDAVEPPRGSLGDAAAGAQATGVDTAPGAGAARVRIGAVEVAAHPAQAATRPREISRPVDGAWPSSAGVPSPAAVVSDLRQRESLPGGKGRGPSAAALTAPPRQAAPAARARRQPPL